MRLRTTAILATVAMGLSAAGTASAAELPIAPIGTGSKTCVPKQRAACNAVKAIGANFAGKNLRGVRFEKANLRGANFTGADLRGASFRGATLGGANFSYANLKGAKFGAPKGVRKRANQAQSAPRLKLPAASVPVVTVVAA